MGEIRGEVTPEDMPVRGRRMNVEALGDGVARWRASVEAGGAPRAVVGVAGV